VITPSKQEWSRALSLHGSLGRALAVALLCLLPLGCGKPDPGLVTAFPEPPPAPTVDASRPNILLILVDDLGFTDLGFTGSEIRTPNIDALAAQGTFLSGLHATPTCSPTRAALMSGVEPHLAGLGTMAHGVQPNQKGLPGYEGYLNDRVVSIPTLLRDAGYNTAMAGKWHLGAGPGQMPGARGFQRSFSMMPGGASHFADAAGLTVFERKVTYFEDDQPVSLPADFFSTTFYTDKMIAYLQQMQGSDRPFFGYVAYTAPHWPLQAPDDYRDRYRGQYDEGYEALRQQRIAAARARGLFPQDAPVADLPAFIPSWDTLEADDRQRSARSMEIYAAMVEQLDAQIGRLLDALRATGQYDNTLIVFTSDNGPEGNDIGQLVLNRFWLPLAFDNSLENMGRENSYVWYDAGWASASAGPFHLYKSFTADGGIRVPTVLKLPASVSGSMQADQRFTMMDLAATLLDVAGVEHPGQQYRGKQVLPLSGRSQWPLWNGSASPGETAALVMELFGRRMVKLGDFKAVYVPPPFGAGRWQLYDAVQDPGEVHDIAAQHPQVMQQVQQQWQQYVADNGVILPEGDGAYVVPPATATR
tara:strand:- start:122797 stop:124560 length:1764 start_codon:yes stop_codon:yes gene_type:complete